MKCDYIKCGDCLELINDIPDKSINIVLTSPPYNMTSRKGGYADKVKRYDEYIDWKPEKNYINWMMNIFNSLERILIDNGVILFNFSYSIENPALPYKLVSEISNKTNLTIADTIIWKKKSAIPFPANKCRLTRIWEFVFVIVRKKEVNTFNVNKKVVSISEKTKQKYYEVMYNVIEAKNNDGSCDLNKATFSTEFATKLINMYSISNDDIILDPFMGTGTTPSACVKCNRHYIGFELSPKQFEYAFRRIEEIKQKNDI